MNPLNSLSTPGDSAPLTIFRGFYAGFELEAVAGGPIDP